MNYFDVLFAKKLSGSSNIKIETLDVVTNGTYFAPAGSAYGTVNVDVPSGSVEVEEKGVNFWDYDGTLVASYTKSEFAALSAMPDNPSHDGLTAQGWNWSLTDAKSYVADTGMLDIGQQYITSDGKTRLYVEMVEGRLNPELNLTFTQAGSFTVDWGDGTTPDTVSGAANKVGTATHIYANPGKYVVTITVNSGTVSIVGSTYATIFKKRDVVETSKENIVYCSCIMRAYIGENITLGNNAFSNCKNMQSISLPQGSITAAATGYLATCSELGFVALPKNLTTLNHYAIYQCTGMRRCSLPAEITYLGNYSLSLTGLQKLCIPPDVTTFGSWTFQNSVNLKVVSKIPEGVTALSQSFMFGCNSLENITLPSTLTSINNSAFQDCVGLGFIRFLATTPPRVNHSNAFANLPTDCIILVPNEALELYEEATNYPDPEVYTYVID